MIVYQFGNINKIAVRNFSKQKYLQALDEKFDFLSNWGFTKSYEDIGLSYGYIFKKDYVIISLNYDLREHYFYFTIEALVGGKWLRSSFYDAFKKNKPSLQHYMLQPTNDDYLTSLELNAVNLKEFLASSLERENLNK